MANLSAYRVYASTVSSVENLPYASLDKEMHIVLAFARDYDIYRRYATGKFEAYFDKSKFDAQTIKAIKRKSTSTSIKFFLSIGGRDPEFPFAVTSSDESTWIKNATDTLKNIVQTFGFDGIDVYYEHIKPDAANQFPKAIKKVIWDLKNVEKVITKASITVSAPLTNNYDDLYKENEAVFDFVVYQTHSEPSRFSNFKELEPIFDRLTYPKEKIFAGHSDVLPSDWANVPLPIFLGAVPQLLNKGIFGISKWIVTPNDHNPESK
ncbi:ruBisCO-associated protein-like [Prosopis cineraria]|uniref:ruBisCO-associated protein-like n=1 Tax=Prosopis cineraria TaxID=364024 RepID=UPI0024107DF6|nr:ruBisCO-associated protein-like [Prosopis cineraria]